VPVADKLRVGVIFGGRSAEHQVSLVSAASVINALDKNKYEVVPIGITSDGRWLSSPGALKLLKDGKNLNSQAEKIILPDPGRKGLVGIDAPSTPADLDPLDVIFPVLHGTFGEDGTVQGLFELAGLPYVGAGVLGSSAGMDKVVTKQLCEHAGIPVAPYLWFFAGEFASGSKQIMSSIERKLRYPCFVKPANLGSSVGISKVHSHEELRPAIQLAAEYDRKILVEKSIENAREIEVGVLGNEDPIASLPGEILSSNEFYDYDAKYVDGKSTSVIPAHLPKPAAKKLMDFAVRGFKAIDCAGMARVDFLVRKGNEAIFFNEINTIPGFTSISMYPKLWSASGIPYSRLLDRLIELALERFRARKSLKTTFQPKTDWYRHE
jgi:D-alanine-D-alanine ligase